jgi:NAD(P)-dependent dehydrogenase (short-subunit alcohol dehydrogenase family)
MTNIFHHAPYAAISLDNPNHDQTGRTVLITGSSEGIGYAIAKAFTQAKASRVILIGRRPDALSIAAHRLEALPGSTIIRFYTCDINDEASIEKMWQSLRRDNIYVDILVLNAADTTTGAMTPINQFLPSLRTAFDTNVFANASMAAHFLAATPTGNSASRPRTILNISSAMAHSNPAPQQAAYSTSKAAFALVLQRLADEVPATECQIINIQPGAILTRAFKKNAPQAIRDAILWDEGITLPDPFREVNGS